MRVLVLGVSGMLGNAALRVFRGEFGLDAHGSARSDSVKERFPSAWRPFVHAGIDVAQWDGVIDLFARIRPEIVVNCIGIVKQLDAANDPLSVIPINTLLPHRLARTCRLFDARLIHVSTDCVFSGRLGGYTEQSVADAEDLYGRSKLLGEVDYPNALTLRTSIVGRELATRHGLVDWFLSETGTVRGFTRAIFSGLTTDELSRVIVERILPRNDLFGVWHVGAAPISKHDLLLILRSVYEHRIEVAPDPRVVIDRSLNSARFRERTAYVPPDWQTMIERMRRSEWHR